LNLTALLAAAVFFQVGLSRGVELGPQLVADNKAGSYVDFWWGVGAALNGVLACVMWRQFDKRVVHLHALPRIVVLIYMLKRDGMSLAWYNQPDAQSSLTWSWPNAWLNILMVIPYIPIVVSYLVYLLEPLPGAWKAWVPPIVFVIFCLLGFNAMSPYLAVPQGLLHDFWPGVIGHLHVFLT
jgi:hypothetical protein